METEMKQRKSGRPRAIPESLYRKSCPPIITTLVIGLLPVSWKKAAMPTGSALEKEKPSNLAPVIKTKSAGSSLEMVSRYVHYASSQALVQFRPSSPLDQLGIKKLKLPRDNCKKTSHGQFNMKLQRHKSIMEV